jgi:hypothetical protein
MEERRDAVWSRYLNGMEPRDHGGGYYAAVRS